MLNLGQIAATVQRNCHISDAQFAGDYTLCIFLLKMREFFRWENQIPFTGTLAREEVGKWMQEREQLWEDMEASTFDPLILDNHQVDAFDTERINRTLVPQGYVYSAGYGRYNKPHFFLGDLQRREQRDGYTVYVSSCEYARDLVAPPAMLQNGIIYLRQESLRRVLWERVEEWSLNRQRNAAKRALACYDFEHNLETSLDRMTEIETEAVILHEVGEAMAGRILGEPWHDMLTTLSRTNVEIMARAARDLLADCLSTLPRLIDQNHAAALHFYFASYGGMRRYLFPEALVAYQRWVDSGNPEPLHGLVRDGAQRWLATTQQMLELYRQLGPESGAAIEQLLGPPPTCQHQATH